jgi:ATP synthase protein I
MERVSTYTSEALLQVTGFRSMTDANRSGADHGSKGRRTAAPAFEDTPEAPFKTLSREEAAALRASIPQVSPWRVIAAQAAVGILCAAITWLITQRGGAVWSTLYGAAAVVVPGALLARGMTRGTRTPVGAAAGFLFWEMLKIGVAITMLVIAARVVPDLSWPALLVTMVVCIKVNWVALLWRGR